VEAGAASKQKSIATSWTIAVAVCLAWQLSPAIKVFSVMVLIKPRQYHERIETLPAGFTGGKHSHMRIRPGKFQPATNVFSHLV
jgi:hypothetical protein